MRVLSHTEASALLECEARWDFRYHGTLAGSALQTRTPAVRLREGKVWGRAVAAWHGSAPDFSMSIAKAALNTALVESIEEVEEHGGVILEGEVEEMRERLLAILADYTRHTERIALRSPELEIDVPLPSRGGIRPSNRYRFQAFLDGIELDEEGRYWLVEFKLRANLSSFQRLALDRQGRRYAWAWWRATGQMPAGIVYDERVNVAPGAVKINKDGRPSRDKRQLVRAEAYAAACAETGTEPEPEAMEAFASRPWQARHRILYRPEELFEAGRELVSIAHRIADLESGRFPVRAPSTPKCGACPFHVICPNPRDDEVLDALFVRVPAKSARTTEKELPRAA